MCIWSAAELLERKRDHLELERGRVEVGAVGAGVMVMGAGPRQDCRRGRPVCARPRGVVAVADAVDILPR